jgi:hypothetical protein
VSGGLLGSWGAMLGAFRPQQLCVKPNNGGPEGCWRVLTRLQRRAGFWGGHSTLRPSIFLEPVGFCDFD